MFIFELTVHCFVFLLSLYGVIRNRTTNILMILICIELALLSSSLNFIMFSVYLDDFIGNVMSLFILTVAAAESAIGLAILILFFKVGNDLNPDRGTILKG